MLLREISYSCCLWPQQIMGGLWPQGIFSWPQSLLTATKKNPPKYPVKRVKFDIGGRWLFFILVLKTMEMCFDHSEGI